MSKYSLEALGGGGGGGYRRHCNDVESLSLRTALFITSVMKDSKVQRSCCSVRHEQLSARSCI